MTWTPPTKGQIAEWERKLAAAHAQNLLRMLKEAFANSADESRGSDVGAERQ